jgi:hypothetical protein
MFSMPRRLAAAIPLLTLLAGCATDGRRTYVFTWLDEQNDTQKTTRIAPDIRPTITQGVYGRVLLREGFADTAATWSVGLTVHAHPLSADGRFGKPITGRTDENGFYEIELPPGQYIISPMNLQYMVESGAAGVDHLRQSGTAVEKVIVFPDSAEEVNFRTSFRP